MAPHCRDRAAGLGGRLYAAAQKVYEDTGTIWENYAPDSAAQGVPGQPDFCGWSGLITVAIPKEFLGGDPLGQIARE